MLPTPLQLRLFVAIDPPAEVRDALEALPEQLRGVSWTPPGQFHVTLRFIGEIDADKCEAVTRGLTPIRVERFILPVIGVGAFPPDRPPRVVWAGLGTGHPRLHQLRQRVDDTLLAAGIADLDVKAFHPHITLGRCGPASSPAAVAAFLKKHRDFEGPAFRVEAFTLYQSTFGPSGVTHTPLQRIELRAS